VDAVSSVAEELTKEISLCLRYYTVTFRGKRVEQAFFTGGGAYEYILLDVLRRHLAVDIEVAQPLKGFDMSRGRENLKFDSDRRGLLCEWAVAVGLSLKGWKRAESVSARNPKEIQV
jgi:type IV pilus assembly protein PilM